jgi:hypothetical protein
MTVPSCKQVGLAAPNLAEMEVAVTRAAERGSRMNETTPSQLNNVIPIDDEWIKNQLGRVVSIGTQSGPRPLGPRLLASS